MKNNRIEYILFFCFFNLFAYSQEFSPGAFGEPSAENPIHAPIDYHIIYMIFIAIFIGFRISLQQFSNKVKTEK